MEVNGIFNFESSVFEIMRVDCLKKQNNGCQ